MQVVGSSLVQHNGEQIDDIFTHISSIFGLALNWCEYSPEARINMTDAIASLVKIKDFGSWCKHGLVISTCNWNVFLGFSFVMFVWGVFKYRFWIDVFFF